MPSKLKDRFTITIVVLIIIQLVVFYYLKYANQNLPLTEFSFSFIGNIFNLAVFLLLILGFIFLPKEQLRKKVIIYLIAISYLLLTLSSIAANVNMPFEDLYILGQPGNKIIVAFLFTLYQWILFSFISIFWLSIFKKIKISLFKSFINGILLLIFFLIVTFFYFETLSYSSDNWSLSKNKKNIGVVLGAAVWTGNKPSPSLSLRVEKAIELYNKGYVGKILLTGGNAPGELSEAEVAFIYAKELGMDTTKIFLEQKTTSSSEQIQFIMLNLVTDEDIKDIIIISDSYHLPRALEISRFYNINIKLASSKLVLDYKSKLYNKIRESLALIVFWCFAL
ncbi:MAG: YdcF family protein [Ignavibacteria bacterium]|nr:YdcF family protein [Ignavibacteria bacterium]